ncbi:hypothetical protein J2X36_003370 [Methylobacterium sp. BE186]|uniref:DUF4214 domain-containing protein n=1 Tax=Methylobacterium sp. BE186 TaxID=2817715 RepID=UPI00286357AA|nr:DUF4214 domain-containing protein [Methylobacterium sp. BE186]MDR7038600.1 hypothetical protein [Methylobacterium sp. BE186]
MTAVGIFEGNDPSDVERFEAWFGGKPDFIRAHGGRADWSDYVNSLSWLAGQFSNLKLPLYWNVPMFANGGTLEEAASGAYDTYYVQAAQRLLAASPTNEVIYVRVGEEFNSGWMPWAAEGHEQSFIGAFRSFVESFRSVSSLFRFEWNVNIGGTIDPAKAYPGDAYVDVVGMDFYYNVTWDPKDPVQAWNYMVQRPYGLQWLESFAASHGKPTAYSEWGINSDAAAYIEKAAEWFQRHDVLYQSYWDSNSDFAGRLSEDQYSAAAAAYKAAFAPSGIWTGTPAPGAPVVAPSTDQERQLHFGTISHDVHEIGGTVYALYEGLLGRVPDALGAADWAMALSRGATVHEVVQEFLSAPEAQSQLGSPDSAGFVAQLYDTVLGREGDAAGLQSWIAALGRGMGRADVASAFVFSEEHVGHLKPALDAGVFVADAATADVARLYYALLDRAPDTGGLKQWAGSAQGGMSLSAMAQEFLASGEYAARHPGPLTDAQYVDMLYQQALGRAPDPGGAQSWLTALAHGATRADLAVGIAESAEAQVHLVPVIESGWHLV